eukprot:SAG31_NODE_4013_length_3665_cov_2.254907_2_plen_126_part_00
MRSDASLRSVVLRWYGLVGNSKYYDYTVCTGNNGSEVHGSDYAADYFTDRIANRTLEFLANVTAHKVRASTANLVFVPTIREIRDFIREKYGTDRESVSALKGPLLCNDWHTGQSRPQRPCAAVL